VRVGSLTAEDNYSVQDPENEKRYHFKLREALARARKRKLLEGITVHITPECGIDFNALRNVAMSAGAKVSFR
jgi:mediator of DNA damage checkpoint protein 1